MQATPNSAVSAIHSAAEATALEPLVIRYLEHVRVERRLAARTVTLYELDLIRLADYAKTASVDLLKVQTSHIRRWVAQMHSGGRSGRGIALILSGWRGFYVWLGREGLIASNPVQDVKAPKAAKPLPKALSVDDSVQLASYQNEAQDPWLEARDAAMVELLYGSGLRVAELVGLDAVATATSRGWVDMQAAEVHVLGKGGKRRAVPVGAKAMQALEAWNSMRAGVFIAYDAINNIVKNSPKSADKCALFLGRNGTRLTSASVWQRLRRRSLQAGLAVPVHPHMLRHSFASHVLQSSGDLRAVQELLGHSQIATTQVYTRLDFQHLAKAYDAAHPRAKVKAKVLVKTDKSP
jgi:integrase/recombinase XerC